MRPSALRSPLTGQRDALPEPQTHTVCPTQLWRSSQITMRRRLRTSRWEETYFALDPPRDALLVGPSAPARSLEPHTPAGADGQEIRGALERGHWGILFFRDNIRGAPMSRPGKPPPRRAILCRNRAVVCSGCALDSEQGLFLPEVTDGIFFCPSPSPSRSRTSCISSWAERRGSSSGNRNNGRGPRALCALPAPFCAGAAPRPGHR